MVTSDTATDITLAIEEDPFPDGVPAPALTSVKYYLGDTEITQCNTGAKTECETQANTNKRLTYKIVYKVQGDDKEYSATEDLYLEGKLVVLSEPWNTCGIVNLDFTGDVLSPFGFDVSAGVPENYDEYGVVWSEDGVTYQWQKKDVDNGDTDFVDIPGATTSGYSKKKFSYTNTPIEYRVKVKKGNQEIITAPAKLSAIDNNAVVEVYKDGKKVSNSAQNIDEHSKVVIKFKTNGPEAGWVRALWFTDSNNKYDQGDIKAGNYTLELTNNEYVLTLPDVTKDMSHKKYGVRCGEGWAGPLVTVKGATPPSAATTSGGKDAKTKDASKAPAAKATLAKTGSSAGMLLASGLVLMAGGAVVLRRRALR